jgi:hypothetical protein
MQLVGKMKTKPPNPRRRCRTYKSPLKYPIYVYSYQLALLCGWNVQRVERLWEKHGIAMYVGGYCVTTPEQLRTLWPEQWEAVLDMLEEGKLEPPKDPALKAMRRARWNRHNSKKVISKPPTE